ncbi:MAG: hypothetical protein ACIAS6_08105 [Phycisphaerales bacterium JB060]
MTTEKICVVCGEDCAARPRLKDSQGRYACQSCVQSKRRPARREPRATPAAKPAAVPTGGGVGFSMDDYLGEAPAVDANPCPKCGMGRPSGAVVCMACGFDSASGRAMRTKVGKDKPKRARSAPRVSGGMVSVIIALSMLVLLPAMALASPEAAATALIFAGLWAFVAYIYMIGAAFRDDDKFWAIIGLMVLVPVVGGLCWLAFVLYYCTIGSQRGVRKLNYWAALVAFWISFGILASSNPDLLPWDPMAAEP